MLDERPNARDDGAIVDDDPRAGLVDPLELHRNTCDTLHTRHDTHFSTGKRECNASGPKGRGAVVRTIEQGHDVGRLCRPLVDADVEDVAKVVLVLGAVEAQHGAGAILVDRVGVL